MSAVQIAWRAHPDFPLVLLFNRTEAHARPTEPAAWWGAPCDVLGGRDLRGRGTWFAVGRGDGRFALVTGYREAQAGRENAPSRGELPLHYLAGDDTPVGFTRRFMRDKGPYAPFNLIVGSPRQAHYAATRSRLSLALTEGLHSLSTGLLDQRMAPTERLGTLFGAYFKAYGGFTTLLDGYPRLRDAQALVGCELPAPEGTLEAGDIAAAAFVMLADRHLDGADGDASTSDGLEERRRSAVFVTGEDFGTRSSTVFIMGRDGGLYFEERSFDAEAALSHRVVEQWRQDPSVFGAPGD